MRRLSFLFAGDVMVHGNQLQAAKVTPPPARGMTDRILRALGRKQRAQYDFSGYFQGILPHIRAADIAVCNLETTLTAGEPAEYPKFKTPEAIADAIAQAGFACAVTANNHCFDQGTSGIIKTCKALRKRGLQTAGTKAAPGEKAYALFQANGVTVALLNFTYETAGKYGDRTLNNLPLTEDAYALINTFRFEALEEDMEAVRQQIAHAKADGAQVILVYFHWGNEYERHSNVLQKYVAWRTACMGADAIIGSHPHVIQELGYIRVSPQKRVPVFYSLGNYIWGAAPRYGRETVLNNILARLDISFDEQTGEVQVTPSYIPLYICQKEGQFGSVDLRALAETEREAFAARFGITAETVLEQIREAVENQCDPAELYFDRVFQISEGERVCLTETFLPPGRYTAFRSEDAIIASVLQNGYVIGNSPGYVGMAAADSSGAETAFLVQVLPGEPSRFPVLVNEHNAIRDIYLPPDRVSGADYGLPEELRLCAPAAEAWHAMQAQAREDGICLKAVHAFRTKKDQTLRRQKYALRYSEKAALRRYQRPGCTEHHLGLAVDVTAGECEGMVTEKADAFRWVDENAWHYGFLVRPHRYSLALTAYIHLRYLEDPGLVRFLTENRITLEQYLTNFEQYNASKEVL